MRRSCGYLARAGVFVFLISVTQISADKSELSLKFTTVNDLQINCPGTKLYRGGSMFLADKAGYRWADLLLNLWPPGPRNIMQNRYILKRQGNTGISAKKALPSQPE